MAAKNFSVCEMGKFADLGGKEFDGRKGRFMLGEALGLTGCEVSVNSTPAGGFAPFLHTHKMNEEVYIILRGSGMFHVDGEEFPVQEGSMIRVAPAGSRGIKAVDDMIHLCIQANKGSLTQATMEDGVIGGDKASWMQKPQ